MLFQSTIRRGNTSLNLRRSPIPTSFHPGIHGLHIFSTFFRVNTDSVSSGFSVVQNLKLESVALIEWQSRPVVEVREILPKISQWLGLLLERTYVAIIIMHRIMSTRGKTYRWAPSEGFIQVCQFQLLLRAYNSDCTSFSSTSGVILELITEAVHIGLLEVCVTAAVLLMSGRNID
ncbi:hypothetical protein B0H19DRAFT_923398 [Mycena capillaripes]|nr:hypothetical protein B0H19DRAFT_923398 [Mycena capillaripes]